MKFLCINTAGIKTVIALFRDGAVTAKEDAEFKKASAVCLSFIDELLDGAGISLSELDFIGVVTGPGSFTGIRIGLSTAKAFSFVTGVKLVPVTLHEVLSYSEVGGKGDKTVTLSDAANGLTYATVFGKDKEIISETAVFNKEELAGVLDSLQDCVIIREEDMTAKAFLAAVKAKYEAFGASEYELVRPFYVRKPQAEETGI